MVAIVPFDDQFASVPDYANMYRSLGLSPIPARGKQPCVAWMALQHGLTPAETFARWYGPNGQYLLTYEMGLLTGQASDDLFIVDLDVKGGPDAMQWWADLLLEHNDGRPLPTPTTKTPSGGWHVWLKAPQGWRPPTIRTALGVDIRGDGGFVVEAPTKGYDSLPGLAPWEMPILTAPGWLTGAVDALRATPGHPHIERTPSGQDFSPLGVQADGREQLMRDIIWAVWCDLRRQYDTVPIQLIQAEHDRAWAKYELQTKTRLGDVQGTNAERLELEGRGITAFNEKWVAAGAQWDTKLKQAADERPLDPPEAQTQVSEIIGQTPDPDFTPFNPWARFNALPFPFGVLPPPAQALVSHVSQSIGVCPNATAMTLLATVCAALNHDSQVKVGNDWAVRPNLWLLLVGDPGVKKSPLIDRMTKPFEAADTEGARLYAKDYARWKSDGEEPGGKPVPPPRYLFMDATVEPIAHQLQHQPRGALVLNDEAAAWLASLENAKGRTAIERGFYLRAYQGGFYRVDRMTRESFNVENLCLSFIGGVQPDRIGQIADLTSDGLLQRFNVVMMGPGDLSQRKLAEPEMAKQCRTKVQLLMGLQRQTWMFDEDALTISEDIEQMSQLLAQAPQLAPGARGWLNKLPAIHAKIALALHVLAAGDPLYEVEVGVDAAESASVVVDFMISHTLGFYEEGGQGDPLGIREAASWLLTDNGTRYTSANLKAAVRPWRDLDRREIVRRMSVVTGYGVVAETGTMTIPAWEIDPRWRAALADERALQTHQKSLITDKLADLKSKKAQIRQKRQERGNPDEPDGNGPRKT